MEGISENVECLYPDSPEDALMKFQKARVENRDVAGFIGWLEEVPGDPEAKVIRFTWYGNTSTIYCLGLLEYMNMCVRDYLRERTA